MVQRTDITNFTGIPSYVNGYSAWLIDHPFVFVVTCLCIAFLCAFFYGGKSSDKVNDLGGIPIISAWQFFTRRYDFIRQQFRKSGRKHFRFKVLQHRIVALSGEGSRRVFFTASGLSMSEGYRILTGGAPDLKDVTFPIQTDDPKNLQSELDQMFVKRVQLLVKKDRVASMIPIFLGDMNKRMAEWGNEGSIDPFFNINDLVFQMTIRFTSSRELAEDRESVDKLATCYWNIEQSNTPFSLLFPWLPSRARRLKESSTTALYSVLLRYVTRRRECGTGTDAIDILISQGETNETIVGAIIGIIFTGMVATGVTACWTLIYLGLNPKWKQRALEEFRVLFSKHASTSAPGEPLHKRLSSIPLSAWEDELPAVDLIIRETIRLTLSGSAVRRNMNHDILVDGVTVSRGEFLTYQIADAHMDPDIYPDPETFDPERYIKGREEDKKEIYAYLGWGAGRHVCAGMKMAKIEVKIILSLILLRYDYDVVDVNGNRPKTCLIPDRNDTEKSRPIEGPIFLKYRCIVE